MKNLIFLRTQRDKSQLNFVEYSSQNLNSENVSKLKLMAN